MFDKTDDKVKAAQYMDLRKSGSLHRGSPQERALRRAYLRSEVREAGGTERDVEKAMEDDSAKSMSEHQHRGVGLSADDRKSSFHPVNRHHQEAADWLALALRTGNPGAVAREQLGAQMSTRDSGLPLGESDPTADPRTQFAKGRESVIAKARLQERMRQIAGDPHGPEAVRKTEAWAVRKGKAGDDAAKTERFFKELEKLRRDSPLPAATVRTPGGTPLLAPTARKSDEGGSSWSPVPDRFGMRRP